MLMATRRKKQDSFIRKEVTGKAVGETILNGVIRGGSGIGTGYGINALNEKYPKTEKWLAPVIFGVSTFGDFIFMNDQAKALCQGMQVISSYQGTASIAGGKVAEKLAISGVTKRADASVKNKNNDAGSDNEYWNKLADQASDVVEEQFEGITKEEIEEHEDAINLIASEIDAAHEDIIDSDYEDVTGIGEDISSETILLN